MSACGSCRVCCTVMAVEEIAKPHGEACVHLCGKGCSIYQFRPASCSEFECLWLQTQTRDAPLPKSMRPDRCGVMFVPIPWDSVAAHCTTKEAFDEKPVSTRVNSWLRNGIKVVRIVGEDRTLMRMDRQ